MPKTGATPTTGAMPLTGATPTTGAPSRTESQVVGGIIGSGDSERSQGSSEPNCSCATPAWPLAEVGAEPADGCPGSLDGWELMASEGDHQVYKKPYLDTGLFQYKGAVQSSDQNKVNVPFAFRFRATVLAFKRNAKRTLNGRKKDATKRIRFDIVGRNLPFYGTIDMCACMPGQ